LYDPPPQNLLTKMIFVDSLHISLKKSWPFGKIFYTLDGTEPTKESAEYTHAILVTNNGTIKSVFILDNGRTSKIKSGSFTKTSPLRSRDVKGVPGKGLNYRYFEGTISSIANFDKLDYKNSGSIDIVGLPRTSSKDAFGLNLEGLIKIPQTGVYTFKLVSDDGS